MSKRGRKKACELGNKCPYQHEHQHASEFYHDDAAPAVKKRLRADFDGQFQGPGRKLGAARGGARGPQGRVLGGQYGGGGRTLGGGGRTLGGSGGGGGGNGQSRLLLLGGGGAKKQPQQQQRQNTSAVPSSLNRSTSSSLTRVQREQIARNRAAALARLPKPSSTSLSQSSSSVSRGAGAVMPGPYSRGGPSYVPRRGPPAGVTTRKLDGSRILGLTIKQPWASAIMAGVKKVENRNWWVNLPPGGAWVAIHAGAKMETFKNPPWNAREHHLAAAWPKLARARRGRLPRSCFVGLAHLSHTQVVADYQRETGDTLWSCGPNCIVIDRVIIAPPEDARLKNIAGAFFFWRPKTPETLEALQELLARHGRPQLGPNGAMNRHASYPPQPPPPPPPQPPRAAKARAAKSPQKTTNGTSALPGGVAKTAGQVGVAVGAVAVKAVAKTKAAATVAKPSSNGSTGAWACTACTYVNTKIHALTCSMCGTHRPRGK